MMNNLAGTEYLVKAWDSCETSKNFAKSFLAFSRHGNFFISIAVDLRTQDTQPRHLGILEESISDLVDDIAEDSDWLEHSVMDLAAEVKSDPRFKALQNRFELSGLGISLVESALEFDCEEDREATEVIYPMRGLWI